MYSKTRNTLTALVAASLFHAHGRTGVDTIEGAHAGFEQLHPVDALVADLHHPLHHQLAAVIIGRIGQEQGRRHVGAHPHR